MSARSSSGMRTALAPIAPIAMLACSTRPCVRRKTIATPKRERRQLLARSQLVIVAFRLFGKGGSVKPSRISSGRSTAFSAPVMSSLTGRSKTAPSRRMCAEAFNAMSGAAGSAAGEALAILPPMVARLRICVEPTEAAASAITRKAPRSRSDCSSAAIVQQAPMCSCPRSSIAIRFKSGIPPIQSKAGRSSALRRWAMIQSVPPDRICVCAGREA